MPIDTTLDELRNKAKEAEEAAEKPNEDNDTSTEGETEHPKSTGAETGEFDLILEDDEPASTQDSVPKNVHVHKLRKAKARAQSAETELEELKARLERVEAGNKGQVQTGAQVPPEHPKLPTLSQFDHDEDQYAIAMSNYLQNQAVNATNTQFQRQDQERFLREKRQQLAGRVDEHINRAGEFIRTNEKAGLSADLYLQAEDAVRTALDPQGKGVFDQIIAGIGEGSEKVTYYLGRNPSKLMDLQRSMKDNPDGIGVLLELGSLKEKLNKRQGKRVSGAPTPDEAITGGEATTTSSLTRKIKAAEDSGDLQASITLRKQAREANIPLE